MFTFVCITALTVLLPIAICRTSFISRHTLTAPPLSLQCQNNTSPPTWTHTRTRTPILSYKLPQSHEEVGGVVGHQRALSAIEGLEDSGYLEHDRASLWVVHPLGAVQRVLQHVFKCCTQIWGMWIRNTCGYNWVSLFVFFSNQLLVFSLITCSNVSLLCLSVAFSLFRLSNEMQWKPTESKIYQLD